MALITNFTCRHCSQLKYEIVNRSGVCSDCRVELKKIDEEFYMAKLALLPLEERVKRIELALYRLNGESRLAALEAINTRY